MSQNQKLLIYPSRFCSPIKKITSASGARTQKVYRLSVYKTNLHLLQSETAGVIQLTDELMVYL